MSSGSKAYWDKVEDELLREKYEKFTAYSEETKFKIIDTARDGMARFLECNPSLTKYQWNLINEIENNLKKLFN